LVHNRPLLVEMFLRTQSALAASTLSSFVVFVVFVAVDPYGLVLEYKLDNSLYEKTTEQDKQYVSLSFEFLIILLPPPSLTGPLFYLNSISKRNSRDSR